MRLLPILVFSSLLHGYVALRLYGPLTQWPVALTILLAVLLASAVLAPLGLLARRLRSRTLAHRVGWIGLLAIGLFSSLFVLTLLRDLVLVAAAIIEALAPTWFDEGQLRLASAGAVPLLAVGLSLTGLVNARRTAKVVEVDIPIADLPPALDGFTIVQISDIHVGATIKRGYVEAIVKVVNGLNADMVAITGDLVDGRVSELAAHVAPLGALESRHGSFFVTGNHEYYSGVMPWLQVLRNLKIKVLLNQHQIIRHDGAALAVAGVTDYSAHHFEESHRSDPQAAINGAPDDVLVRVLLAHQPRSAPAAAEAGFQLQLSGHTHGGQFLPWTYFVKLQQPYIAGLHRLGSLWVYTSRGTGYWGPPKRFGAPSEITKLRLVPA